MTVGLRAISSQEIMVVLQTEFNFRRKFWLKLFFYFSGGAELLFDKIKKHEVELQGKDCKDVFKLF